MTKEMAQRWLPILQAIAEGKTIQKMSFPPAEAVSQWVDCEMPREPMMDWCPDVLRVKPEAREFWITHGTCGYTGVHASLEVANKFCIGNYPAMNHEIIHVREVL